MRDKNYRYATLSPIINMILPLIYHNHKIRRKLEASPETTESLDARARSSDDVQQVNRNRHSRLAGRHSGIDVL